MRIVDKAERCVSLRGCGTVPNPETGGPTQRAKQIIYIDGSWRERLTRLSWAKKRWIGAGPGREIIIMKGGSSRFGESWVAVFVEGDKGILSVRGAAADDAIEQALALLEPSRRE